MTQPSARWRPTTLPDLESAISNGLIEENHLLEIKRELKSGQSANKDIAKDIPVRQG
ncbi:hypothetical protein MSHI_02570 [Mycobacterium shinjukuense]|uniref:Uncharacterized protein n=1 Tax=Mycobacterium shinjukuense TaxID=398694 RepID=A0A7I7MJ14_9MYCO|nr:hypothetical protein MSHI_02570 [Mycobacterium shinjukuense]